MGAFPVEAVIVDAVVAAGAMNPVAVHASAVLRPSFMADGAWRTRQNRLFNTNARHATPKMKAHRDASSLFGTRNR